MFASCIQQSSTIQSSPRVSSLRWTKDATLSFDHCVLVQHDPVSKASRYSYLKSSTTFATSLHDSLVDHNRQHSNNISLFPLLVYRFLSHVRLMPTGPQASRSRTATKWTKCLSASAAVWKSAWLVALSMLYHYIAVYCSCCLLSQGWPHQRRQASWIHQSLSNALVSLSVALVQFVWVFDAFPIISNNTWQFQALSWR